MNWAEVIADPNLNDLPYKIELNEWGNIVMSPASNQHGFIQTMIAFLLMQLKASGKVLTECSISTSKGVKVADAAWGSNEFFAANKFSTPYLECPEICIEIISPSNSQAEMAEKRRLYFERGAKEVWICSENGEMNFFSSVGELQHSKLILNFPVSVLDSD
jgi:Uma2 family endonuclease